MTTPAPAPDRQTAARQQLTGLRFTKGHGTGNDFVLVEDQRGDIELTPDHVQLLADRHRGIGGDGVIRVVRSAELLEGRDLLESAPQAEWFMDYRNGDGSIAEMCGNGVRVFVHYLAERGLVQLEEGGSVTIGTRAGARTVTRTPNGYAIDMGAWSFLDEEMALERAADSLVLASGLQDPRPALSISMGNPHTVVALAEETELEGLDLHQAPNVDPVPPHGSNVEFVVPAEPLVQDGLGRMRMRVHERGVGETLSCGTGACAAAAAVRVWAGEDGSDRWAVDVPGGTVGVEFVPAGDGTEHVVLSGPAELVFDGVVP